MATEAAEEIPDQDPEAEAGVTLANVAEATLLHLHAIARDLVAEATVEVILKEEIEEPQLTTKPDTEGT